MATEVEVEQSVVTLSYEEAFSQLEDVLTQLEREDLPLEASLALYEKGVALSNHCSTLLDGAELRVRQWQGDGSTADFTDWQEG